MNASRLNAQLQAAVADHRAGRLAEAEQGYAALLGPGARLFDVWHLAGLCALQRQQWTVAIDRLRRAQTLNPRHALCVVRLGVAHARRGEHVEATKLLRRAVELDPKLTEGWLHLAETLREEGRPVEALEAARRALQVKGDSVAAHELAGSLLADLEGFEAALPCFRRLVALAPDHARGWCNLGIALANLGQEEEALEALDRCVRTQPDLATAHLARGLALQQLYRLREALAAFEEAIRLAPTLAEAHSARLLTLQYLDDVTPAQLFASHREFGRAFPGGTGAAAPGPGESGDGRRLKLAFLSADFRRHAVAQFVEPLLRHLDRDRFSIWLYHDHRIEDDVSERLRQGADRWRNFAGHPAAAVAAAIRADAPDILVDLAGHTGRNRLPLFTERLAPLQLTYLGYPGTTGLVSVDARLVDSVTDPFPADDALHSEELVRFAPCAWCWQPPADSPAVVPPPGAQVDRPLTFGSFNNFAKVSDATVALWTGVLRHFPDARLVLKSHGLDRPVLQRAAAERFARHGVAQERLVFLGRQPDPRSHLEHYAALDVALDTYPYHGTTTTCEALWMGRPVVTLRGDRHASRVGASLLRTIGHPEWVAHSPAEYVQVVARLVEDRRRLATVAEELRPRILRSPLVDGRAHARAFGAALLALRDRHGRDLQPTPPLEQAAARFAGSTAAQA